MKCGCLMRTIIPVLLIGVVVGTYSSIGIATPLLQKPRLLRGIIGAFVALAVIGFVFADVDNPTTRWVVAGVVAAIYVVSLVRGRASSTSGPAGHPARA